MTVPAIPGDGTVRETAAAKINLALHVTGQRADGYHLLDSMVTFAQLGDRLTFSTAASDSFHLEGRFGPLLAADTEAGNLVLKARDLLREVLIAADQSPSAVAITLEKNLPVAAGIGGGSADAAATLRGLLRLWDAVVDQQTQSSIALKLGADVPMCLLSRPLRVSGIGDMLQPLGHMPAFSLVLGNPLKAVSTPAIFKRLSVKTNPAAENPPEQGAPEDWISWLSGLRNDLQPPAVALLPQIADLMQLMLKSGAKLVRMSGSGATCFGIYRDRNAAEIACEGLSRLRPDWYFTATTTLAGDGS